MRIEIEDKITIAALYESVKNPHRKWWQVWKPRRIQGELMQFKVEKII